MNEAAPNWLFQQSVLVVGLVLFIFFLWRYALPKLEDYLEKQRQQAEKKIAERDAAIAAQQAKHETLLQAQITAGQEREEQTRAQFLASLQGVTQEHSRALSEVAGEVREMHATVREKVKRPPARKARARKVVAG